MPQFTGGGSQVGSAQITDDSIVNDDINSAAGIAITKLAGLDAAIDAKTKLTLLHAGAGTDTDVAAKTVDSIAISGLTNKDTILVKVRLASVGNNSGACVLYSVTDSTNIIALGTVNSSQAYGGSWELMKSTESDTLYTYLGIDKVSTLGAQAKATGAASFGATSMATNWTGNWTLGLRHGGVVAGGSFQYEWSVYKLSGQ